MKKDIRELFKKKIVILDGATGTQLQTRGMPPGACPEIWCLDNPDVIRSVHQAYVEAGADVIYTCTFGANRKKLTQYKRDDVAAINTKLARIARHAAGTQCLVAGDIGPTGAFIKPFGELDFEEAVDIFKEQVRGLLAGGVDLFVIETMIDIQEARAALLAVKEVTRSPIIVTMTFEKSGRTLSGNDPVSSLITLQSLGVDALGCNCSGGPAQMLGIIRAMKPYAMVPLVAKPNAGLPRLINEKTVFTMKAKQFAVFGPRLAAAGAAAIGGCCGTTPQYIQELRRTLARSKPQCPRRKTLRALSSARGFVVLEDRRQFFVVGEKINPTGKQKLQAELSAGNFTLLRELARTQEAAGAELLDVNVGMPGVDEAVLMCGAIGALSVSSALPLVIDSSNPTVIEQALRFYPGRALINSISGEQKKIKKLLPIAKKYGAMFILLPIAGKHIPLTVPRRIKVIQNILKAVARAGISKENVVVDGLVMTVSCNPTAALVTLKTVRFTHRVLRLATIIGLSNVSFGLPNRRRLNQVFLALAKKEGLTLAIADPRDHITVKSKLAQDVLLNRDKQGARFIAASAGGEQAPIVQKVARQIDPESAVSEAIVRGNKEAMRGLISAALAQGTKAFTLMHEHMVPAIVSVGELFERKEYFLPQLIACAEAMKEGVRYLEPYLEREAGQSKTKGVIILATVEGDVHDIGKNIVTLLLRNHGFEIVDLGKDVSSATLIREIKARRPDIVGLSALMTTTMVNMKDVLIQAAREGISCQFMIGGAVVNKTYADAIGAHYAKDGVSAVRLAEQLTKKQRES